MEVRPTHEQELIVEAAPKSNFIVINAVAGSGKTSTNVLISEVVEEDSLYLAFNKSMVEDALGKFPRHVTCKTMHSLAYGAVGVKYSHKLFRPKGAYKNVAGTGSEIGRYFHCSGMEAPDKHISSAFLGLLAKQTVSRFESSAADEITRKHLPKEVKQVGYEKIQDRVLDLAVAIWEARVDRQSPVLITHDTYLKLYQLSSPKMNWDVIYADEFQDVTPCFADILSKQTHAKVVMTGDSRQQIYAWRGAVNALQDAKGDKFQLTKSFRYGQAIADIATKVLQNTVQIKGLESIDSVVGFEDVVDYSKPVTILYRTNGMLVNEALGLLKQKKKINIVADIAGVLRKLESVEALHKGQMTKVKHEEVIPFEDWDALMVEAEEDGSLMMLVRFVLTGQVRNITQTLKTYKPSKTPDIILVTAHKSKGLEWDQVVLAEDFPSPISKGVYVGLPEQEENLLYVACTRAKLRLEYNTSIQEILTGLEDCKEAAQRECLEEKVA